MSLQQSPAEKKEPVVVTEGPPGLVKGYLEDFCKADIIVNSAPANMKLHSAGDVSKAILSRAGDGIQEECNEKYPNGIKHGEVAITKGHKLPYSLVFHCTVQTMNDADSFKQMAELIKKCLMEADGKIIHKNNGSMEAAKTIAFPLLGTGPRNFSPDIIRVFYRTMLSFILGPTKSLENAYIIVRHDKEELIKVMEDLNPFKEYKQATYENSYPYTWQTTQNNIDVINLPIGSEEFMLMKDKFDERAPHNAQLLSIERVQNKALYNIYLREKCKHKILGKSQEKQLWLDVESNHSVALYTNGLDANHRKDGRNGTGYYFCESSNLADDQRRTREQTQKMYYGSVAIGKKRIAGQVTFDKDTIPPRCYAAVDNTNSPTIYVIFNEKLFYPHYLFTYE